MLEHPDTSSSLFFIKAQTSALCRQQRADLVRLLEGRIQMLSLGLLLETCKLLFTLHVPSPMEDKFPSILYQLEENIWKDYTK